MEDLILNHFREEDETELRKLIQSVGWNDSQIEGQIVSIKSLVKDSNGYVLIAKRDNEILGYISAQLYEWNKLSQIHGLVINPNSRRQNIATKLVEQVEEFMRDKKARGIYVDTPVDNEGGRNFYKAIGFNEAYIMPEYYNVGKDGVTYIKFYR